MRSRIRTANIIVIQLYPVWKNKNISNKTNIRILNTNVKLALLAYMPGRLKKDGLLKGDKCFGNKCLQRTIAVFWPSNIK